MGTFSSLQRQKRAPFAASTTLFARSARPSAPVVAPFSQPISADASAKPEHARHFGHSFARIPIFSSERENNTGLPDPLKAGIEHLSGISIDDVKVHYHSSKPTEMQAWAYTRGTDIYAETGQEKYLPHEAWHAVQQKQGRVQPTLRTKGVSINDDRGLETEADVMGMRAMQLGRSRLAGKAGSGSGLSRLPFLPAQQASLRPARLPRQPGNAPIQRGIKKLGGKGETYKNAPKSYGEESFSKALKQELQKIIDNDEKTAKGDDFTLRQAIAEARRRVGASGRFLTGRPGKRMKNTKDVVSFLNAQGASTTTTEDKFKRMGDIYDAALNAVEVTENDFRKMPISTNPDQAHTYFVSTFNEVVPSLTRTASAFGEVAEAMVAQGGSLASSMKGSQFEHWARQTVLTHANKRITVKQQGKMASDRSSDAYDAKNNTLWDMKHYFDTNVPKDQAEDYYLIVTKGYTSTSGDTVNQVNYLFPSIEGAKQNKRLNTLYGFGIYYADKDKMKQLA